MFNQILKIRPQFNQFKKRVDNIEKELNDFIKEQKSIEKKALKKPKKRR